MAEDIFKYAEGRVSNKGILARIGHSPKLHSFRSATTSKGSFASKGLGLLGVAGRAGLNAIPIPALGGIIGKIEQAVEGKIRTWHHKRRGRGSFVSVDDKVKFSLKELSVQELDRYRKKVEMAVNDLNKASAKFESQVKKKRGDHAACDSYLELAEAAEQATRRLFRLRKNVMAVQEALNLTLQWANKVEHGHAGAMTPLPKSVNGVKEATRKIIQGEIEAEMALAVKAETYQKGGVREAFIVEYHGKCGQWCCFRESGKPDNWMTFKDNAATATRFLTDPFTVEDIIGVGMAVDSANKADAKLAAAQNS
jgi:hypothetical protein